MLITGYANQGLMGYASDELPMLMSVAALVDNSSWGGVTQWGEQRQKSVCVWVCVREKDRESV